MGLHDLLLEISTAQRLVDLERLSSQEMIAGDFRGSVTGKWVKLDASSAGVVEYNSKQYITKVLGFTSIPAGTAVELTYADGVYYSKW